MLTLLDIGNHLDMSESAASSLCRKLSIHHKSASIETIRIAYVRSLRLAAAGRTIEGKALSEARARESRLKGDKLEMEIAEKAEQLVDAGEMQQAWCAMITAFRIELGSLAVKVHEHVHAEYGVKIKDSVIEDHIEIVLGHMAAGAYTDEEESETLPTT